MSGTKSSRLSNTARAKPADWRLKLIPDYTVEFVWIMAKYQACSRPTIEQLLRTPTITKHVAQFRERLAELEAALVDNARLSEALKELAVELSLHQGRQRSGFSARSPLA